MHCTYEFNSPGVIHVKAICSGPGILFFKIPIFSLSKKEDLRRTWKTGIMRIFILFTLLHSIIIRSIELKWVRWKVHVKNMGNLVNKYKIFLKTLKGEATWVG
jgi:hypothetical protein